MSRWAHWASSLIDRHGRLMSRRETLNFVLLRPASIVLSPQRWFVSSLMLRSQINLAIQPILRNTAIDRRQTNYLSSATAANMAAHHDSRRFDGVAPIGRQVVRERSDALAGASAGVLAGGQTLASREMNLTLHTPLARIFHQLREAVHKSPEAFWKQPVDRIAPNAKAFSSAVWRLVNSLLRKAEDRVRKTAGQNAEKVAGDVTRRLQRVEERFIAVSETVARGMTTRFEREAMLAKERAGPKQPQGLQNPVSQWETHEPPAAPHLGAWLQAAARAAQIDIERLADQVMRQFDRRIVAQRERMGKV